MRLRSVSLRGVTRFSGRVDIPFDQAGPGLVAVVGANGAGKTTILEAVPAALYKGFPSRPGKLYDHCHGRDAFIEAAFEDGDATLYRVRLAIDADKRETEGYIFQNGDSLTSGRAVEFAREVDRLFGSQQLLLASVFAAQNRAGNFLLMAKGDRKDVFVGMLGLGYMGALSEVAGQRRSSAEQAVSGARAVVQRLDYDLSTTPVADQRVADAALSAHLTGELLEQARANEQEAVAALERAKTADDALAGLRRELGAAVLANDEAKAALREAEKLDPAARQAAARRKTAIEGAAPDEAEARARKRHEATIRDLDVKEKQLQAQAARREACEDAVKDVEALEAERTNLEAAAAEAARLASARAVAFSAHRGAKERRDRLTQDTVLLGEVPCTAAEQWIPFAPAGGRPAPAPGSASEYGFTGGDLAGLAGTCKLLAAARESKAALEAETATEEAQRALDEATRLADAASLKCDDLRLGEVKGLLPNRRIVAAGLAVAMQAERDLAGVADERSKAHVDLRVELDAAGTTRERIRKELAQSEATLEADLEEARVRMAAATKRLQDSEAAREKTAVALAAREKAGRPLPAWEADLSTARQARLAAEREHRQAEQDHTKAQAEVDRLTALAEERVLEAAGLAAAEREVGDWSLLEKAFGRDGLQALELEAAAPEVAKLTNDMLEACYGPRFQVGFETLREKKSAKGEFTEVFDVRVFDEGHERQVEALSGGERVVVGEAIGLALAIFNARRSGIQWRTIFRDETAGALDQKNAIAYVDMLRKAMALGGFDQVVFVAHQPEVWERADARILIQDGSVRMDTREIQPQTAAV